MQVGSKHMLSEETLTAEKSYGSAPTSSHKSQKLFIHASPAHTSVNFRAMVQEYSIVHDRPGPKDPDPAALNFAGLKSELGGKDFGAICANAEGHKYLIKTGITRSLLYKICKTLAEAQEGMVDKEKKAEEVAGYIAYNYNILTKDNETARLSKEDLNALKLKLIGGLKKIFSQESWLHLSDHQNFTIDDLDELHRQLVENDESLRNMLGLPILMDVINGAAGQHLINNFQSGYLAPGQIAGAQLMIIGNKGATPLIGSQLLKDVQGLDHFLVQPYLPKDVSYKSFLEAAKLLRESKGKDGEKLEKIGEALTKAQMLVDSVCSPENLARGKDTLKKNVFERGGLKGFFAGLLIRLTMGESADLGPDNMLLMNDAVNHIDITGFRHQRQGDTTDPRNPEGPKRLGWTAIFKRYRTSGELLLNHALSERYVERTAAVRDSINDVLLEVCNEKQVCDEVLSVMRWYARLDATQTQQSLKDTMIYLFNKLDERLRPDIELMDICIERCCGFITTAHAVASSVFEDESRALMSAHNLSEVIPAYA